MADGTAGCRNQKLHRAPRLGSVPEPIDQVDQNGHQKKGQTPQNKWLEKRHG
jgi:hypothetical protein